MQSKSIEKHSFSTRTATFFIDPLMFFCFCFVFSSHCMFCPANSLNPKDFKFKTEKKQQILTFKELEQVDLGMLLSK